MPSTPSKTDKGALRASCDRCRAQKLRCIPSSHHTAAPCQRCLKAKTPMSCVFSRRSRTGRAARAGSIGAGGGSGEHGAGSSSMSRLSREPWLPGTSTFMLSTAESTTSAPREPAAGEASKSTMISKGQLSAPGVDEHVAADAPLFGQALADLWDHEAESAALGCLLDDIALQPPAGRLFDIDTAALPGASEPRDGFSATTPSPMMEVHYTYSQAPAHQSDHLASYQDFALSPAAIASESSCEVQNATDPALLPDPEKPGPLIDLTTLLAEMSHYENQLSKLLPPSASPESLDDYPIGDALFLSQRFHLIVTDYMSASGRATPIQPTPPPSSSTCPAASPASSSSPAPTHERASHCPSLDTFLPTITCYLTLTRIYSSIFSFLLAHLSGIPRHPPGPEDHHHHLFFFGTAHGAAAGGKRQPRHPRTASLMMHAYRGRRLGQLKETCLCAGWDPVPRARNAVAILLASLGGAEAALALPADVRVVTRGVGGEAVLAGGGGGGGGSGGEQGGRASERATLPFDADGCLYRAVREQVRELRDKVEEVDALLKELLYG